jgi:hypothetical protein
VNSCFIIILTYFIPQNTLLGQQCLFFWLLNLTQPSPFGTLVNLDKSLKKFTSFGTPASPKKAQTAPPALSSSTSSVRRDRSRDKEKEYQDLTVPAQYFT